jgi:pyruvate/2-oxoacid:ferredoxin oxidoreductase beta subunit
MKKGLVLAAAWMLFFLSGCGSDQRETLANHALTMLDDTNTKIVAVRERIEDAMKKMDKGLNLQDAMRACEELKRKGKELQNTYNAIHALRDPVPEEERKQYVERLRERIQSGILKLNDETLLLNSKFRELQETAQDPTSKAAVEELEKKLKEAQGEYDSLARQR